MYRAHPLSFSGHVLKANGEMPERLKKHHESGSGNPGGNFPESRKSHFLFICLAFDALLTSI